MSGPMRYFAVTNLERHQHYKDRRPPWIKLHVAILDDYDFARLQDASKAHAMLIWALASQRDNRLPMDPAWIGQKISATGPVDLDGLVSAGFLTLYDTASDALALRKQSALVETETETEAEKNYNDNSARAAERDDPARVVPIAYATFGRWDALERGFGEALLPNVVGFIDRCPAPHRGAVIALLANWVQGELIPPSFRPPPSPLELAAAVAEYRGDYAARHIWAFVRDVVQRFRASPEGPPKTLADLAAWAAEEDAKAAALRPTLSTITTPEVRHG